MPGFGNSEGKPPAGRSEKVLDKGGAGDVVRFVIKELGLVKPVVIGYDWGAAIALKLSIKFTTMFSKVVAFHPSFNETENDELKKVKTPVLILWCRQDQFHAWSKWQVLAKKIPNA